MKRVVILTICVIIIIVIAIVIWNINQDQPIEPSITPPPPSDIASLYFVNDVPKSLTVGKANVNVTLPLFDERGGQPRPGGGGDQPAKLPPRRLRPAQLRGGCLRTYPHHCSDGESPDTGEYIDCRPYLRRRL